MKLELNPNVLRQGDVLCIRIDAPRELGEAIKRDRDAVILAYGEVTGHAHAIRTRGATLYQPKGKPERFLKVVRTVSLTHEEHSPVKLDPGIYRVLIQQDYTPSEMKSVED